MFPNVIVTGNYDPTEYYGCFDVYLKGVGPLLDEKGRYFLFKQRDYSRFPRNEEISDKLVALSMLYGSTTNISFAQKQYKNANRDDQPSKNRHGYPAELSPEAEFAKNNRPQKPPEINPERTKFYCTNATCGQIFTKNSNHSKACRYHKGVWQFGSYNV